MAPTLPLPGHPLAVELASLWSSLESYQTAAHQSSIQLQGRTLEASFAQDRIEALEKQNETLLQELAVLRTNPSTLPPPDPATISHLQLELTRTSSLLESTSAELEQRSVELARAQGALTRAYTTAELEREALEGARRETAEAREEARAEREKRRRMEEDQKLLDLVLKQYAQVVRDLETRTSTSSQPRTSTSFPPTPLPSTPSTPSQEALANLSAGRTGLTRLLSESAEETARLEKEIEALRETLEDKDRLLKVEWEASSTERDQAVRERAERHANLAEETVVRGLIQEYMTFSQQASTAQQALLDSLRTRHAATLSTLQNRISELSRSLSCARSQSARLRTALDVASLDLAREAAGRRREVAVRLSLLRREEALCEALERDEPEVARRILDGNADLPARPSASLARVVLAEETAQRLAEDLERESEKRVELERERLKWLGRELEEEDAALDEAGDEASDEGGPDGRVSPPPPPPPKPHAASPVRTAEHYNDPPPFAFCPPTRPGPPSLSPPTIDEPTARDSPSSLIDHGPTPEPSPAPTPDLSATSPATSSPPPQPPAAIVLTSPPSSPPTLLAELSAPPAPRPPLSISPFTSLQPSFNSCSHALEKLKSSSLFPPSASAPPLLSSLHAAVLRLDDVVEDARVELEIRIADEERARRVGDAFSDAGVGLGLGLSHVGGRGVASFERRLEDIVSDIGTLQKALEDMAETAETGRTSSDVPATQPNAPAVDTTAVTSPGWTSWSASLFGAGHTPQSTRPPSPALLTFGEAVARSSPSSPSSLRRSPSSTSPQQKPQSHVRTNSLSLRRPTLSPHTPSNPNPLPFTLRTVSTSAVPAAPPTLFAPVGTTGGGPYGSRSFSSSNLALGLGAEGMARRGSGDERSKDVLPSESEEGSESGSEEEVEEADVE